MKKVVTQIRTGPRIAVSSSTEDRVQETEQEVKVTFVLDEKLGWVKENEEGGEKRCLVTKIKKQ